MRAKKSIIVFLIVLSSLFSILSNVTAADNVTVNISMFGWEKLTHFNNPVVVAGVWHYVNISKSNQNMDEFSFKLFKGYPAPDSPNRNETNYYEWKYNENNQTVWSDISGYGVDYINSDYCTKNGNVYSFCIGVKDTFPTTVEYIYYYENWTLEVYGDGNKLYSGDVVIEKPRHGYSRHHYPDYINFFVDPFKEMDAQGNDFFQIGNSGNIPMYVNIDYKEYDDIEITDLNKKILAGEDGTHYFTLHSKKWPPGIKDITVQLNTSIPNSYLINTNATITFKSSYVIDAPALKIYVGHSNYEIIEIENTGITFQYLKKLNMYEGEIKNINAYVSGDSPVTLEIWTDGKNISLLKLLDSETETTSPIRFVSSSSSERMITMIVEAVSEGTIGIINYRLTTDGVTKTYTTQITIGPPESQENEPFTISLSPVQIIVIIIVLLIVIYMFLSYFKHKRR